MGLPLTKKILRGLAVGPASSVAAQQLNINVPQLLFSSAIQWDGVGRWILSYCRVGAGHASVAATIHAVGS